MAETSDFDSFKKRKTRSFFSTSSYFSLKRGTKRTECGCGKWDKEKIRTRKQVNNCGLCSRQNERHVFCVIFWVSNPKNVKPDNPNNHFLRREVEWKHVKFQAALQESVGYFILRDLMFHIEALFCTTFKFDAFLITMICQSLNCFNYAKYL